MCVCMVCKRDTARPCLCESCEGFGLLGGRILGAEITEFIDPDGTKSRFPHTEWMKLDALRETDAGETLTAQLGIILAVHGWKLDYRWGVLPGDVDGGDERGAAA